MTKQKAVNENAALLSVMIYIATNYISMKSYEEPKMRRTGESPKMGQSMNMVENKAA
jgi:hypothetical protein